MTTLDTSTIPVKRAAGVWRGQTPESVPDRVAAFRRDGFLVLPGVLTRAELDELYAEMDRVVANHTSFTPVREGFRLERNPDESRKGLTFRKIGGISDYSPAFMKLAQHPKLLPTLHALLGPTLELWRDVVMMKPARVGREKPWHQDSVYWPWQPMNLVSAMTALDDAMPENGCLQVIPGTHTKEVQHYGKELQIDPDADLQARTLYVPLKAGDTLIFHSLLLHASEPNPSDQDRRVCINSYKTPELRYIREGEVPHCPLVSRQ